MWSHYANEHRGICLRFRFGDGWISDNIREVKYVDEIYLLKAFDEDIESKVREVLCKKFSVWEYEQEYRIFLNANAFGKRVVKYEKTDLERVIFGLRISREDATSVYNIIRENYLRNDETIISSISVTDIFFDVYLGKWNYRAIPKVKTWSYFLTIP